MDRGDRRVRGWLISFEGIEGVGKTTQVDRVRGWLERQGHQVQVVREPGGTAWGEAIREVVLHQATSRDAVAEFLLFAAARAELVHTVIAPWLDRGGVVLADRYIDSSEAYQGWGGGADLELIRRVNAAITAQARPNHTFWLDGESRAGVDRDNMESRGDEFFDRVQEGYRALCRREPERVSRIAADAPPDEVFDAICSRLQAWMLGKGLSGPLVRDIRETGGSHEVSDCDFAR